CGGALYTGRTPPQRQNTHSAASAYQTATRLSFDAYKRARALGLPIGTARGCAGDPAQREMGLFKLLRYAYGNRLVKHD
ncbi:hypothetical protein BO998_25940, partial [Citrobacter werkmanii]